MDIDIDISPKYDPHKLFNVVSASMIQNENIEKHPVGVYFQNIPIDPISNYAAIPYKEAENFGYYKIDILHLNLLSYFESKQEIRTLLRRKPNWKLLESREIVKKLFHLGKHFDVVYKVKPTSVIELADTLAIIRPYKIKLLDKYVRNKKAMRQELYTKRDKSDLRKSHAVAYALLVVLQLNLIDIGIE